MFNRSKKSAHEKPVQGAKCPEDDDLPEIGKIVLSVTDTNPVKAVAKQLLLAAATTVIKRLFRSTKR